MADKNSTRSYIKMANELLSQLRIPKRIHRLEEIGANIFVPLYEGLCGEKLPEIKRNATSREDQLFNLQAVIDNLSTDVLHVSLSHIRAEDIILGDRTAICNLLEIFQGLMEYLLQRMDSDTEETGAEVHDLLEDEGKISRSLTKRRDLGPSFDPPRSRDRRTDEDLEEEEKEASILAQGEVGDPLTTSDLRAERVSDDIEVAQRVASELGHLTDAVAEASQRQRYRQMAPDRASGYVAPDRASGHVAPDRASRHVAPDRASGHVAPDRASGYVAPDRASGYVAPDRASELRRRICEYLSMRRPDLDLLASDLKAAGPAEEEWLRDYMRQARADRRSPSPRREQRAESPGRLMEFPEEHQDRVDEVRNYRPQPSGRSHVAPSASQRPTGVAAVASEGRRAAERAARIAEARRVILRDCFDHSLEAAERAADEVITPRRDKVTDKENAIKRVAALRDGDSSRSSRRGTGGLVKPRIKFMGTVGRTPPSALSVALPDDAVDADRDLLAHLIDQFPYLQLSPQALNELWYRATRQKERLAAAARDDFGRNQPLTREQEAMAEAERRQRILTDILHREIGYNRRLRDRKERESAQRELKARERERRLQAARAKKYYEEFALQMRSKMMRSRDKEEVLFRKLFKEALRTQRERILDMRKYSRDVRDQRMVREMDEIKSLENFYRDRFNLLAQSLRKERKEIQTQDNEQTKFLQQMKRELRQKMEAEVRQLQNAVQTDQDDSYFRERDADRLLFDIFRGSAVDLK